MKTLKQVSERIAEKYNKRESFKAKANIINKSFENHNKRFKDGKENFSVSANYNDLGCFVNIFDKEGRPHNVQANLH